MIVTTDESDFKKYNVDGYLVNEKIITKLSTTVNAQNILGIVKMPHNQFSIDKYKKIIILDNINDPGNLGTIIRTAAALGMDAVIVSEDTVDMFNEKVIRATQGSIFKIPVIKTNILDVIKKYLENNIDVFATSLQTDKYITDMNASTTFALVFGNEANGIRNEVMDLCNKKFKIQMHNNVESLNVAIAAAIVMYHFNK